jgi:hypothetical protein
MPTGFFHVFIFSSRKITDYTLKIGHACFLLLSYMITVYVNMIGLMY